MLAVEPPGHGTRMGAPLPTDVASCADCLAADLLPETTRPYAVFGHSLGAIVAYEVARRFTEAGRPPVHLFVAGHPAPGWPRVEPPIRHLSDHDFLVAVHAMDASPSELLDDGDVADYFLPVLRADFTMSETYAEADGDPLPCPITALGGLGDAGVPTHGLDAWWRLGTRGSTVHLPGGHFFLHTARAGLLGAVARDLLEHRCAPSPAIGRAPARAIA